MNLVKVAAGYLLLAQALDAEVRLSGTVLDTTRNPVAGAKVSIETPGTDDALATVFTDLQGRFTVTFEAASHCSILVERTGFYSVRSEAASEAGDLNMGFTLQPVRELTQSLEVASTTDTVDMDTSATRRTLGSPEIANIPYPNSNDLRNALRIIPGVIRDNRGGLHIQGGAEEQTLFTLNGFNVNDPLSGRFDSRFSVEAVQNVDINSGALAAEFGKGSTGVVAIRSQSGDDRFRSSGTNFIPGFENRKGWTLSDWTPRFGLSGPIRRGRAWFSNSSDVLFVKTIVRELPKGDDRTTSLRWSDLLSGQVNLSPGHILHAGLLVSQWTAARTGLTALDPWETTIDKRSRQWMFHARDQLYLSRGWLVELGFAANRTYARDMPQGHSMLWFTPFGKRGNYYADATRRGSRDQILANTFLPGVERAGSHQLKAGFDLNRTGYAQSVRRSGYEQFNETGARVYRTVFGGPGQLHRTNFEAAAYAQDSWRPRRDLLVEAGLRLDWDRLVNKWSPSPRLGVAWSPGDRDTKVFGGITRVFDASTLRLFSRPDDQFWLTTYYRPDGAVNRGPALSMFAHPAGRRSLRRPSAETRSLGVEHHWRGGFSLRADFADRQGRRGFAYLNSIEEPGAPPPDWALPMGAHSTDAVYRLTNQRLDHFRSYSVTARHTFQRQYQWMASYTRSSAVSNAVIDVNADDPITAVNNSGPMPWDSPHRFTSWGYLPLPRRNWAVAFLTDARTGFPFFIRNDGGGVDGKVNSHRYPAFFEMNVHIERRFQFRHHLWALRMGANNLTGRINPDSVNNIAGSPHFLRFYGGTGRATNFRIRWLGKAAR
jgi:hypothetical protein